jgi:hypothetical protein
MIRPTDPDFRICSVNFDILLEIQSDAEKLGYATRWSSVDMLRAQVKEREAVLQTLMREKREGVIRSYRCLLLFSAVDGTAAGGVATIDLNLSRLESLERLDRDPDVRKALVWIFSLALGGISGVEKK